MFAAALIALCLSTAEEVETAPPLVEAVAPTWAAMISTSVSTGQGAFSGGISIERRVSRPVVLGVRVDLQAQQLTFPGQPTMQMFRVDFAPLVHWYVAGHAPSGVWLGAEVPLGLIAGNTIGGFTVGGAALLGYSVLFDSGLTVRLSAGPSLRYFSQYGMLEARSLQASLGGALAVGYAW